LLVPPDEISSARVSSLGLSRPVRRSADSTPNSAFWKPKGASARFRRGIEERFEARNPLGDFGRDVGNRGILRAPSVHDVIDHVGTAARFSLMQAEHKQGCA